MENQNTYYKLVPYFKQLGIKYNSFNDIRKDIKVSYNQINRCFNTWLKKEREKNKDKEWFRGLGKPEQFSANEDDYATRTDFTYTYEDLSKEEKEIYNRLK